QPASAAPGVDDDPRPDGRAANGSAGCDGAESDEAGNDEAGNDEAGKDRAAPSDPEKAAGADVHHGSPVHPSHRAPRRLHPARDVAAPVYVQEQGATIGKSREVLIVRKQGAEI